MRLLCLTRPDDREVIEPLTASLTPFGDDAILDITDPDSPDPALLESADAVLCGGLPEPMREKLPRLKWVQFWSAGVDGKTYKTLFDDGAGGEVIVCTGSGIHVDSCANHVLSMLLAFARGLPLAFERQKARQWDRAAIIQRQFELDGKTIGILGTGAIGQAIAQRCKGFGMRTIGVRRHADRPAEGFDILLPHLQYHEMVLESNFIVLALPLTPSTRWIFGEDEIEIVQKGTYLFNIGRGGLIDEKYVFTALKNRWLAGAGLDVFEDEPLPSSSPWWDLDNVIITPHAGGNTPEYWTRFGRLVAEQTQRMLKGEPLVNRVQPDQGY